MTTNDDAMREIEAALDAHEDRVGTWATSDRCFPRKGRAKLLALIRSKLPQPDAEHERAVEAWRRRAMAMTNKHRMFLLEKLEIDEALRLMRARPATCKDGLQVEAAGELLRAAKEAWPWVYGHPRQSDELWQAIAKAERAGIKP